MNYLEKLKKVDEWCSRDFYKIYLLIDPIDMSIFYIGCTKQEIFKRIYNHTTDHTCFRLNRTDKNRKINELLDSNIEPIVEVLYFIEDKKIARIVEKYLIHFCSNTKYSIRPLNRINSFTVNPV